MEQGNWWALVTEYLLTPEKDTVLVGDSREMKLLRYPNGEHYPDWSVSDKDADLLVPLLTPMAANSDVAKVYINGVDWTTSAPKDQSWGGVGYNPQTSQILYVAPSRKPKLNKALVTVEIKNSGSNATFLLSSEITILAENNLTINGHSFDNITVNGSMINGHLIATAAGFDSTGMSGKSQDRVQVKTEYPTPITLDKDITTKTRLFDRIIDPAKPDYVVATDILKPNSLSTRVWLWRSSATSGSALRKKGLSSR